MTRNDILAASLVNAYPSPFRKALALVLEWECEYESDGVTIRWENDPDDSGGETFAGLTKRDDGISFDSDAHWIALRYFQGYWNNLGGVQVLVQEMLFFMGVNLGSEESIRCLQFALNDYGCRLIVDGKLGEQTRSASFSVSDTTGLCMAFLQKVRRHYERIVSDHPTQSKFLKGWENRAEAAKSLLV